MNKALFFLPLLLLLAPGCKKQVQYAQPSSTAIVEPASVEKSEYDDELGAFVVKEDENKFSAAAAAQAHEEDLSVDTGTQTPLDAHADSGKYGLKTLYFEFEKHQLSELRPDQRPVLEHNLEIVKNLARKGYEITIQGHACDSAGSTEFNMMLSEKRAQAIADYFREQGVEGKVHAYGCGCSHLIVPTGSREQQAPNRRVELYVSEQNSSQIP